MPEFTHCAREIRDIVGDDLTLDQITRLEAALKNRADFIRKTESGLSHSEAIIRAAEELGTEHIAKAVIEKRNTALSHLKQTGLLDYIERVWRDDPRKGFEAAIAGTNVLRLGSRLSVAAEQLALTNKYYMGLATELRDKNVLAAAQDRGNQRYLARALEEIRKDKPDTSNIPTDIVTAAKIIDNWTELSRRDANLQGTWISRRTDWISRQYHDMSKLKNAAAILAGRSSSSPRVDSNRTAWKGFIREKLSEETYKDVDEQAIARMKDGADVQKVIAKAREEFLDSVFDSLSTGLHFKKAIRDDALTFKGERTLAAKMSEGRLLMFKNADEWYNYQEVFGEKDVLMGVVQALGRRAEHTALMARFGPNPEQAYANVREEALKVGRGAEEYGEIARGTNMRSADMLWAQVTGEAKVPGNVTGANVGYMVRSIQSMASLGGALLSSFGDTAGAAAELRYNGLSLTDRWSKTLKGVVEGYGSTDRQRLLGSMGVGLDWIRSAVTRQFDMQDGAPGIASKMLTTFFKLNGLTWWTDTMKGSVALSINHFVAQQGHLAYRSLDADTLRMFKLFSITEGNWDVARAHMMTHVTGDNRRFIDPSMADRIPTDLVRAELNKIGLRDSDYNVAEYRREVETKFRSYFSDRADYAVLTPDARTRAMMNLGTQPGTPLGEVVRALMLFKSFPMAVIQKTLGREAYGYHSGTQWNPFKERSSGNREIMGMVQFIASATILGYFASEAKAMLRGQEPLNPLDPNNLAKVIANSMVQGGGLGLLGDFIIGQAHDRFGRSALSSFLGPSAATAEDLYSTYLKMRGGDLQAGFVVNRVFSSLPYMNLFYLSPAIKYGFLYSLQEATSPGSVSRFEQRTQENSGRAWMFPPTDYALGVR